MTDGTEDTIRGYDALSDVDWARLAAFIDSEGCIRIHCNSPHRKTGHRYHGIQITIAQRDNALTDWLYAKFGGHLYRSKNVPGKTTMNYWRVSTYLSVEILLRCLDYFVVKRDQAEIALEYRDTIQRTTRKVPEEVKLKQEALRLKLDALKHGHKLKVELA